MDDEQRKVAQLLVVFLGVCLMVTNLSDLEARIKALEVAETANFQLAQMLLERAIKRTPAPAARPMAADLVPVVNSPAEERRERGRRAAAPKGDDEVVRAPTEQDKEVLSLIQAAKELTDEAEEDIQRQKLFQITPMPAPPQNVYETLPPSKVKWPNGDPNYGFEQTDTRPLVAVLTINAQAGGGGGGGGGGRVAARHRGQGQGLQSKSEWMYPMSYHNKLQYCKKWNYDLIIEDNSIVDTTRDVAWSKIPALKKWLPQYQWIMWMDMDAFFMRFDFDIEHLLNEDVDFIIGKDWHGINMGVFFIRNSPYSMELLDILWNTPKDKWYPWEEQSALMHLLKKGQTHAAYFHTKHFAFPPLRDFNAYPSDFAFNHKPSKYQKGDFIAHFPNCKSIKNCRRIMQGMFQRMMTENMLPPVPDKVPSSHYPDRSFE